MTQIGNKVPGGMDATEVDGRVTTLVQSIALAANAGKMIRVDTGLPEAVRPSSGSISAVANGPSTKVTITAAGHGQPESGTVIIAGTTDYDGTFVISNVTENTFDIIETWNVTSTGTFKADNVYHAPDQHGGYFGTIKRQYFFGNTGGTAPVVLASSGITKLVSVGGYITNSADGQIMWVAGYISEGGIGAVVQDSGGSLTLRVGTSFDDATDEYKIFVDYV